MATEEDAAVGVDRYQCDPSAKNFYQRLGVTRDAHEDSIKAAYRQAVLVYHPDRNRAVDPSLFAALTLAYDTLSDKQLREEYDRGHYFDQLPGSPERPALPGDEVFEAFQQGLRYKDHQDVAAMIPVLEKRYAMDAGTLRFRKGNPCNGTNCPTLVLVGNTVGQRLVEKIAPDVKGFALLLCIHHKYLHQCDPTCTNPDDPPCVLHLHFLAQEWRATQVWVPYLSESKMAAWRNELRDVIVYQDPSVDMPWLTEGRMLPEHACSRACMLSFEQINSVHWVCRRSGRPHVCNPVDCTLQEQDAEGKVFCILTGRTHATADETAYQEAAVIVDTRAKDDPARVREMLAEDDRDEETGEQISNEPPEPSENVEDELLLLLYRPVTCSACTIQLLCQKCVSLQKPVPRCAVCADHSAFPLPCRPCLEAFLGIRSCMACEEGKRCSDCHMENIRMLQHIRSNSTYHTYGFNALDLAPTAEDYDTIVRDQGVEGERLVLEVEERLGYNLTYAEKAELEEEARATAEAEDDLRRGEHALKLEFAALKQLGDGRVHGDAMPVPSNPGYETVAGADFVALGKRKRDPGAPTSPGAGVPDAPPTKRVRR